MIDLLTIKVKKIAMPSKKAAADRLWRDVVFSIIVTSLEDAFYNSSPLEINTKFIAMSYD